MKIGIVGSGFVGSTAAYAMVMQGIGQEIVLVDKNETRALAEAEDILHAVPYTHTVRMRSGGYPDLAQCRVAVIAAGVSQKEGESRLELLGRNAAVFEEVIPSVLKHAPNAVLVIATNPVDVMTHIAARIAGKHGIPSHRIIGSGTSLDTARFRTLLGEVLDVDARYVHGYVVGEHGDSEVLGWSVVRIGGLTLDEFCRLRNIAMNDDVKASIDDKVRNAAYRIIEGKGATYYGIGSALARIVEVILNDHHAIMTVCSPLDSVEGVPDTTISLPHLLSADGSIGTLPLDLNAEEKASLKNSAGIIRDIVVKLER